MTASAPLIDPAFPAPIGWEDEVVAWWLGQAGFALRHRDSLLFIDPYLSDVLAVKYTGRIFPHSRLHPSPVAPADVSGLDLVLCTHGHTDHMDLGSIPYLQSASDPLFVVPRSEAVKAVSRGVPAERLLGLDAGEHVGLPSVTVTAVPAAHEQLTLDRHGQNLFLGYVIELGGVRIYHSGDCAPFEGHEQIIRDLDVDVALLPVNGRDAHRAGHGVPGNMDVDEAVALCRAAGIPSLVCHHWGLFAFNTADPGELRRHLEPVDDVAWRIPSLGEPFLLKDVAA